MPYASVEDLPAGVRRHLPLHAQEIRREAFDSAWRQHAVRGDREALAHRVAWAAVRRRYRKVGDEWVEKRRSARPRPRDGGDSGPRRKP